MSTLAGQWWISRVDGEPVDGLSAFLHGGTDPEPDWVWIEGDEWYEPTEFMAEMFTTMGASGQPVVGNKFLRVELRRWFGLTAHEWEEDASDCNADFCVSCKTLRHDVGLVSAPWDEHCKPVEP